MAQLPVGFSWAKAPVSLAFMRLELENPNFCGLTKCLTTAVVQNSGLRLSDPWCQDPKFVDECQPSPFPSPRAGEVWAHLMVLGGNHLYHLHLAPWSERLQHLQPVIISIISQKYGS